MAMNVKNIYQMMQTRNCLSIEKMQNKKKTLHHNYKKYFNLENVAS